MVFRTALFGYSRKQVASRMEELTEEIRKLEAGRESQMNEIRRLRRGYLDLKAELAVQKEIMETLKKSHC